MKFVTDICRHPGQVSSPIHYAPTHPLVTWIHPALDTIKVNVNRFFTSEHNTSVIGSIFRYHEGMILLHFGKSVTIDSTIHTKILAVKEGLLIATTSH